MKNISTEKVPQVGLDLASEIGSVVVHGQEDALDLKWLIEGAFDTVDSVHELGNPLQSEKLALDGNEDAVGGDQSVQGEQVQGRRAIDDDVVEPIS